MRASALRRWIEKAEENLRVAEVDRNNGYHAAACFHAQQAAELALKALVIFRKGYQPFTHSLVELAKELHDDVLRSLPGIEDSGGYRSTTFRRGTPTRGCRSTLKTRRRGP
jgi:HEPN domain-containing protein